MIALVGRFVVVRQPKTPAAQLEQADKAAWLNDWVSAEPMYRQAENLFLKKHELSKALYVRVSHMPAVDDALGPCVRGPVDQIASFNLGFDLAASTAAGSVTGVLLDGPAFRAGLRNGQRLGGRLSVYNNQPDKIAIVTIQTSEGARAMSTIQKARRSTDTGRAGSGLRRSEVEQISIVELLREESRAGSEYLNNGPLRRGMA